MSSRAATDRTASGRTARALARAVALAVAGLASLVLLLDPFVLRGVSDMRVHGGVPLLMFGATGLFLYGFGYAARTRLVRLVFHPVVAWGCFAAGLAVLAGGG